jgi:hypothetical protein
MVSCGSSKGNSRKGKWCSMRALDSVAQSGFERLVSQYKTSKIFDGNFWFAGNSLHVCLNYLDVAGQKDTVGILPFALKLFQQLTSSDSAWWKDDYGWWGNAFVKAINNRSQLGYAGPSNDQLFKDILAAAQSCWQQLWGNWREDDPYSASTDNAAASTPIKGGTFNNAPLPQTPQFPMSGRNCVTNESFWLLSSGLAQLLPGDPKYAAAAGKEQQWFQQWLDLPVKSKGSVGLLNPQGLVLERPTGNGTDASWYWSGDQGLYISARNEDAAALAVGTSVTKNMVDSYHILHENMEFADHQPLRQFIADYATGKGIVIWSLSGFRGVPFLEFIQGNAAAVVDNQLGDNQFSFNWNWKKFPSGEPKILRINGKTDDLCNLIMQAAGMGALNAALRVAVAERAIA